MGGFKFQMVYSEGVGEGVCLRCNLNGSVDVLNFGFFTLTMLKRSGCCTKGYVRLAVGMP